MSERNEYPPGVPCWVDTAQADPEAATRFYAELFGWEFAGPGQMPGEPPGRYYVARLRGRDVAGVSSEPPAGAPPSPTWITHVAVESADDTAERVRGAGGTVVAGPFDAPPAGRLAVLRDPAGATLGAWEPGVRKGAQLVNAPGAWSMSMLNTSDLAGSKQFYAAVFGWEASSMDFGGAEITLWRLRGYVGGQPQQPVPRDVVGVMAPLNGDRTEGDVPAHWSVDFWVHDADATVAKAAELGGRAVAGPYDTPGFRSAVLADPQGAMFSVSKLVAGG